MKIHSSKSKIDSNKLPGFERLVLEWIKVHQTYFAAFSGNEAQTSFPFRERPQVSLLGTAAFYSGGISLQEWPLPKKSKRDGRNDLWLRLKHNNQAHDYYIEAKHDWIGLENKTIERLEKLLASAIKSAKKIPVKSEDEIRARLALVFATLTYPTEQLEESDQEIRFFISRKLNNFCQAQQIHCWAAIWVDVKFFRKIRLHGKHTSVGLVMLVKVFD